VKKKKTRGEAALDTFGGNNEGKKKEGSTLSDGGGGVKGKVLKGIPPQNLQKI